MKNSLSDPRAPLVSRISFLSAFLIGLGFTLLVAFGFLDETWLLIGPLLGGSALIGIIFFKSRLK